MRASTVIILGFFAFGINSQTTDIPVMEKVPIDLDIVPIPNPWPCGGLKCVYPAFLNTITCNCDCPWWAWMTCQDYQYFDKLKCACPCKEPCKDCSLPQKWSNKFCDCRCPGPIVSCTSNRFWDNWDCRCKCKQKPRKCCPNYNKIWSEKACNCVCQFVQSCAPGWYWDNYLCKCVKKFPIWWQIDFAEEAPLDIEEKLVEPEPEAVDAEAYMIQPIP